MLNSADLPNDINALKALLLAAEQTLRERDTVIAAHDGWCQDCARN
jgi:transposase